MIDIKLTGRNLKQACGERGYTVKRIQKELGVGAFQSVYNWFNGKTLPSLDNFYHLCKLLGVTMESMIVEGERDTVWTVETIKFAERMLVYTRLGDFRLRSAPDGIGCVFGRSLQKYLNSY